MPAAAPNSTSSCPARAPRAPRLGQADRGAPRRQPAGRGGRRPRRRGPRRADRRLAQRPDGRQPLADGTHRTAPTASPSSTMPTTPTRNPCGPPCAPSPTSAGAAAPGPCWAPCLNWVEDSIREHTAVGTQVVRLNISRLLVVGREARSLYVSAVNEGSWGDECVFAETAGRGLRTPAGRAGAR